EAEMTKRITLQAFDFYYRRAKLRENHRAVRPRDVTCEVEHYDPVERRSLLNRVARCGRGVTFRFAKPFQCGAITASGCGPGDFSGSVIQKYRLSHLNRLPKRGIIDFLAHRERADLVMLDKLLTRHHRRARDV